MCHCISLAPQTGETLLLLLELPRIQMLFGGTGLLLDATLNLKATAL